MCQEREGTASLFVSRSLVVVGTVVDVRDALSRDLELGVGFGHARRVDDAGDTLRSTTFTHRDTGAGGTFLDQSRPSLSAREFVTQEDEELTESCSRAP